MREAGWLRCWRGKKKEVPPGADGPLKCGFSNRSVTAWLTIESDFERLAAEYAAKHAADKAARRARYRRYTAEEIDKALEKTKPPD